MKSENLIWLQEWFAGRTNGDWEHCFGIKIETLDNPGWRVTIDLAETSLVNRPFASIKEEIDALDWVTCSVQDERFDALCSPKNLGKVIAIFRAWVEEGPKT